MNGSEGCVRIWLHEWKGNAHGWNAWSLDHLGFATWASSRAEVLDRAPGKFEAYREGLSEDGADTLIDPSSQIEIVEVISGDEVAFQDDLVPASVEEISRCVELLQHTRRGLLATVESLPDSVLDWDPPYRQFDSWAWWKTIRQILAHIALCEVGYYLPSIGWHVGFDPGEIEHRPWQEHLQCSRKETQRFLEELKSSPDRARIAETDETWSVRKVLRRLVWHERLHWKSIQRIARDYK